MAGLIVPYCPDGGARDAAWAWCRQRWQELHPELELIEATSDPWAKTTAVNQAVQSTRHDVVVVSDADLVVDARALDQAVQLARTGWAVPHSMVYRLDAESSLAVIGGPLDVAVHDDWSPKYLTRPAYYGRAGGGIIAVARWAWDLVGGFDERFVAWGGEDVALGWALRALVGPGLRVNSSLWHLWHPQQSTYRDPRFQENMALQDRYRLAVGSPDRMRNLIAERPTPSRSVL